MTGVYMSYRRGGPSMWAAERLVDRLRERLGHGVTVTAVDRLVSEPALPGAVREALQRCDVLVAVIGEDWLEAPEFLDGVAGVRRMDHPDDPVRIEIDTAVELGLHLIPVLVDAAPMPASTDVPEDVRPLLRRHSLPLSAARFDGDAEKLATRLRVVLDLPDPGRSRRRRLLLAAGIATAVIAGGAAYLIGRDDPLPDGVLSTYDLDTETGDVAVAPDGTVWVADLSEGELVRIDPGNPDDRQRVEVTGDPVALAATATAVWVATGSDGTVHRVDATSLEVVQSFPIGFEDQSDRAFSSPALTLVADDEAAWVTARGIDGVRRLDAASGAQTTLPNPGPDEVTSVALAGDSVWVVSDLLDLVRLDATDGTVLESVPLPAVGGSVVSSAGHVWVVSSNDTLLHLEAESGNPVETVSTQLSSDVADLSADADGGVWLTGHDESVVHLFASPGGAWSHSSTVIPEGRYRTDEQPPSYVASAGSARAWAVTSGGVLAELEGGGG